MMIALVGLIGTGAGALGSWLAAQRKIDASLTIDQRRGIRDDTATLIAAMQAELARVTVDRDKWQRLFIDTIEAAEGALDVAEQEATK